MGCFRCGARQVDPVRGASPWRRGVRSGVQVLVCPDCQAGRDWAADLDACDACGSTALVRRLGETVCRACGARVVVARADESDASAAADQRAALQREVAAALDRTFGRGVDEAVRNRS